MPWFIFSSAKARGVLVLEVEAFVHFDVVAGHLVIGEEAVEPDGQQFRHLDGRDGLEEAEALERDAGLLEELAQGGLAGRLVTFAAAAGGCPAADASRRDIVAALLKEDRTVGGDEEDATAFAAAAGGFVGHGN